MKLGQQLQEAITVLCTWLLRAEDGSRSGADADLRLQSFDKHI